MKRGFGTAIVLAILGATIPAVRVLAQTAPLDGDWQLAQEVYGNTLYQRLTIKVDGTAISGHLAASPSPGP